MDNFEISGYSEIPACSAFHVHTLLYVIFNVLRISLKSDNKLITYYYYQKGISPSVSLEKNLSCGMLPGLSTHGDEIY